MTFFGYGVEGDMARTYFWWSVAMRAGHAPSIEWRAKAADALSAERRARIEARAKDWRRRRTAP